MKKITICLAGLLFLIPLASCQKQQEKHTYLLEECSIKHDEEFGGAYIKISINDFNALGFRYGDSIDISFSNDVTYEDIGYYSGYYVPAGQELLVAYPSYEFIKFCINYGDDIYEMHHMDENTTATISMHQKRKYKTIEETLSLSYSDNITDYDSVEEFANFREITTSNIKPGLLYRGASPIDNQRNRASMVDYLLYSHQIAYDIDLSDNDTKIETFINKSDFNSPYFKDLYDHDKVVPLYMAAAYKKDDFCNKMKTMFETILSNDGPFYIHCLEGKDRTGFVSMVIEALCGASYDELVDDYFITYHNYYKIEKGSKQYEAIKDIHIDEMIRYVFGFDDEVDLLTANYKQPIENYLTEAVGLSGDQINSIVDKLTSH